jgi:hypothetical protein
MNPAPDPSDLVALKKRQWLRLHDLGKASAAMTGAMVLLASTTMLPRGFPGHESSRLLHALTNIFAALVLFTFVAALINFVLTVERYGNVVRKLIKARKCQRRDGRAS